VRQVLLLTVREGFFSSCYIGRAAAVGAFKKVVFILHENRHFLYIAPLSLFFLYSLLLKTFYVT
jgi:hypothetical protein